jgi:hypothetical protein
MKTSLISLLACVLAVLSTGCGRNQIKVYHVDANSPAVSSGQPVLQYVLPAGWQKKIPSEMRAASFGISQAGRQADVSVIPLAGMAGSDPANVNRWRGQVGLGQMSDAELAGLADKVTVGNQPADLYDLTGTASGSNAPERILAVILHRNNTSWFFKMTGDAGLVKQEKPAFIQFLKSIQFGTLGAATAMGTNQLPSSHPPVDGMASVNTSADDKPMWTVPTGWRSGPLEEFLAAKYIIPGTDGTQAAVNVAVLTGNGGGLLPNVNRWRGQMGLAPVTAENLTNTATMDVTGSKATLIDMSGTDERTGKPERLIGVVLPLDGQTWFYKLMGDPEIVAQQKSALVKFVESAKYPGAR